MECTTSVASPQARRDPEIPIFRALFRRNPYHQMIFPAHVDQRSYESSKRSQIAQVHLFQAFYQFLNALDFARTIRQRSLELREPVECLVGDLEQVYLNLLCLQPKLLANEQEWCTSDVIWKRNTRYSSAAQLRTRGFCTVEAKPPPR